LTVVPGIAIFPHLDGSGVKAMPTGSSYYPVAFPDGLLAIANLGHADEGSEVGNHFSARQTLLENLPRMGDQLAYFMGEDAQVFFRTHLTSANSLTLMNAYLLGQADAE
jgi:hypothetical protein